MRRAGGGDAASGGSVFDISSLRLETTGLIGMGTGETRNSAGTGSDADTFNSPLTTADALKIVPNNNIIKFLKFLNIKRL